MNISKPLRQLNWCLHQHHFYHFLQRLTSEAISFNLSSTVSNVLLVPINVILLVARLLKNAISFPVMWLRKLLKSIIILIVIVRAWSIWYPVRRVTSSMWYLQWRGSGCDGIIIQVLPMKKLREGKTVYKSIFMNNFWVRITNVSWMKLKLFLSIKLTYRIVLEESNSAELS